DSSWIGGCRAHRRARRSPRSRRDQLDAMGASRSGSGGSLQGFRKALRASRSDHVHRAAGIGLFVPLAPRSQSSQRIRRVPRGVWSVGGAQHMTKHLDRREFIQLAGLTTAGIAGVVFSSGLRGVSLAAGKEGSGEDFMSLQMADLHWGFTGPAVNPDAEVTLDKAIDHVNALPRQPDF